MLEAPGVGISDAVFAPVSSSDSDRTVIATFDGTAAQLWDLNDKSHLASFRPSFSIRSLALSRGTTRPLLLTGDRAIRIFSADQEQSDRFGETLFKIGDPHRGVVTALQWCPNPQSNRFVSAAADGSASIWKWDDNLNQALRSSWLSRKGSAITSALWSPDGSQILLARTDAKFDLCDAESAELISSSSLPETDEIRVLSTAYSSDGQYVALAGMMVSSGESRAWILNIADPKSPDLHARIIGHDAGGIASVAFIPDSPYVVTGGSDGAALVWNWQPHREEAEPIEAYLAYQLMQDSKSLAHNAPIQAVAVSPQGTITTSSEDGTAVVWANPFAID